ncbi:MAG: hypothetical protein ACJ8J0_17440, partial [Longimicrobiaceae bacterium]
SRGGRGSGDMAAKVAPPRGVGKEMDSVRHNSATAGTGSRRDLEAPIQDAIDLVRYLAEVVAGYVRFAPGALTVAPPIDVAVITVHDGFQWVARKQWFNPATGAERRPLAMESGA